MDSFSAGDILRSIWGFRPAYLLQACVEIGLFDALNDRPRSPAELAHLLRVDRLYLEKVLAAAAAMGWLEKRGKKFALSELARRYFVEESSTSLKYLILHSGAVAEFWRNLPRILRTGSWERPARSEEEHRCWILAMDDIARAGQAQRLVESVDLSRCRLLLDLGAGPGSYSIALCRAYPELKAVLFDLPQTLRIAREMVRGSGVENRILFREGSWYDRDYGSGYDVALLSNVLHGPSSRAPMKLKRVFRALIPGGMLIVQDFLLNADKTGPEIPALFNLMVGAFSLPEISRIIEGAGFTGVRRVSYSRTSGLSILVAHKPV